MNYYKVIEIIDMEYSTIQIKKTTKNRLSRHGNLGSTYEAVVIQLLDHAEKCDAWWVNKP